jgi:hypothetical protein
VPWIAVCIALAFAWLATLLGLLRTRRRLTLASSGIVLKEQEALAVKESEAFKVLRNSCRNNDPLAARNALISWARTSWPEERVHSLADLERLLPDLELASVFKEMDRHLYGRGEKNGPWQGGRLLEIMKKIRTKRRTGKKNSAALEPLYK